MKGPGFGSVGKAERRRIDALPLRTRRQIDTRIRGADARRTKLLRLRKARAGMVERRAVGERPLHERVEIARLEHLPPLGGNVARDEVHLGDGTRHVSIRGRRVGRAEIRPDRAARQHRQEEDEGGSQSSVLL